ncbi:hypothetical protein CMK12_07915 [Candidatus Poribacteria bacterium]|nr:hypothetical protein [Candidatus Poribacteria bacterium]
MLKALDRRNVATAEKLYHQLSRPKEPIFYINNWKGYNQVWLPKRQVIGTKHMICLDQNNSNTRHHLGRIASRSKIVSRSKEVLSLSVAR